jgi:hypothetical protein
MVILLYELHNFVIIIIIQYLLINIAIMDTMIRPGPVILHYKLNPTNPIPINKNTELSNTYAKV